MKMEKLYYIYFVRICENIVVILGFHEIMKTL